jgi:hypothetical protein
MKKLNTIILIILTILAVGCGGATYKPPVQYTVQKDVTIYKPFDAVWQSAVEWFATHNTPIKNIDKSSGLISTEYSLSVTEAAKYMDCGNASQGFTNKTEISNRIGNFNVLIKKIDDGSTKVSVNVFFSCLVNEYTQGLLETSWTFKSSTKVDCVSTGGLEKVIIEYLAKTN